MNASTCCAFNEKMKKMNETQQKDISQNVCDSHSCVAFIDILVRSLYLCIMIIFSVVGTIIIIATTACQITTEARTTHTHTGPNSARQSAHMNLNTYVRCGTACGMRIFRHAKASKWAPMLAFNSNTLCAHNEFMCWLMLSTVACIVRIVISWTILPLLCYRI